jgi:hypothetical protein
VFLGNSKGLYIGGSSKMESRKKKELVTIVAPKVIL